MTITEVSELTGIPTALLRKMRARETVTLKSGPPFVKTMDERGNTRYFYRKTDVLKWMKYRNFQVTAGDAAAILNISRVELVSCYRTGLHSFRSPEGELIINCGKNIFIWVPKVNLARYKRA